MASARVTVDDLRGLLGAIDIATTALEAGCEDEDTITQINHASRCYDWVLAEIRRRERSKRVRRVVRSIAA